MGDGEWVRKNERGMMVEREIEDDREVERE